MLEPKNPDDPIGGAKSDPKPVETGQTKPKNPTAEESATSTKDDAQN